MGLIWQVALFKQKYCHHLKPFGLADVAESAAL
jgi:hypothetical protein